MKTEPIQLQVLYTNEEDNFMETTAGEAELDIKYVLPPVIPLEKPLENQPSSLTTSSSPNSSGFLYSNEDDGQSEAELDEIEAMIHEDGVAEVKMEVEVADMKPVAIPIPIIQPISDSRNENEIIVKHKRNNRQKKPKLCICPICNTGFPSQQLFQLHMSSVHADVRPYPCSHCGKRFATAFQANKHETIHDRNRFKGEPKFACDLCDKKYHVKGSLAGHRRMHFGYIKPKRSANTVIREHHSVGVRRAPSPKKDLKVFKCPHCDLKFEMRSQVKKHMTCHSDERPFECEECGQRCVTNSTLQTHIIARHLNPSSRFRPLKPKFMAKQPCPCEICGKVFRVPSQLQKHMTLHTGEKSYECHSCGECFRLRENLKGHRKRFHDERNQLEAYKCIICGKEDFLRITDLRNHRLCSHRHIPLDDVEKEKAFGCGVCGKPYYLRGQAIVCALLKHDPTSLRAAMFKFKCPECPEERLGYHSYLALRRHWENEHRDKSIPAQYRASSGMYDKNGDDRKDKLPCVTVNKELERKIRENGPPPSEEYEFPLYTEFDLLPVEFRFYKDFRKTLKKEPKPKKKTPKVNLKCEICGVTIVYRCDFKRHMRRHENGPKVKPKYSCHVCSETFGALKTFQLHEREHKAYKIYSCDVCSKTFRKAKVFRFHQQTHVKRSSIVKRRVGRPRKNPLVTPENDSVPVLISTEEEAVDLPKFKTVNVNDAAEVRSILGSRVAHVILSRVTKNDPEEANDDEMK